MKILYSIQATGNGHLSRAKEIIPILQSKGELDILVSGTTAEISLDYPVKYKLHGLSFFFGKKGGIDFWKTLKKARPLEFIKDIFKVPVNKYDLIINDYEPVTSWGCILRRKKCIGLGHQYAVLNKKSPKPKNINLMAYLIMKYYAPVSQSIGFHFDKYDQNIYSPVIRKEIRQINPTDEGHYTVYLPAYKDSKLIFLLNKIPNTKWEIFSKNCKKSYQVKDTKISPIDNDGFIKSLASCKGALMGAGFEGPAEALFLGKKLIVIPMKNQVEQYFNAAALKKIGISSLKKLDKKAISKINAFVLSDRKVTVNYPDQTDFILEKIIEIFQPNLQPSKEIELTFQSNS